MATIDPKLVDFVKALARASAARDIARLQQREGGSDGRQEGRAGVAVR